MQCPGCGAEAAPTHRGRMPKWHCPDRRCVFHRGWRLLPEDGHVYAIPVGEFLDADPSDDPTLLVHAVLWRRGEIPVSESVPVAERT